MHAPHTTHEALPDAASEAEARPAPQPTANGRRVLLIGNGPSALSRLAGSEIDGFDGVVARFNDYRIAGYEAHVGTRTDEWITWTLFERPAASEYARVLCVALPPADTLAAIQARYAVARPLDERVIRETCRLMGHERPSSGAFATVAHLLAGQEVWLYGFDHFQAARHHYGDAEAADVRHDANREALFFRRLMQTGRVHLFEGGEPTNGHLTIDWPRVVRSLEQDIETLRKNLHWAEGEYQAWMGVAKRQAADFEAQKAALDEMAANHATLVVEHERLAAAHHEVCVSGDRIHAELAETRAQADVLALERRTAIDELERIRRETGGHIAAIESERQDACRQRNDVAGERDALARRLTESTAETQAARSAADQRTAERNAAAAERDTLRDRLAEIAAALGEARARADRMAVERDELRTALEAVRSDRELLRTRVDRIERELAETRAERDTWRDVAAQRDAAIGEKERVIQWSEQRIDRLEEERDVLLQTERDLRAANQQLAGALAQVSRFADHLRFLLGLSPQPGLLAESADARALKAEREMAAMRRTLTWRVARFAQRLFPPHRLHGRLVRRVVRAFLAAEPPPQC